MADLTSRILVVISASSGGATKELNDLQRQAAKTGDAFDTIGKQAQLAGQTIKAGLVAGAAALVGTQLVGFLQDSVDAFVDGQRAAQLFSTAMNTSGENAGKLSTFLNTLGIDTNDLIEINAEFSKALRTNKADLDKLNVTLKKNADGTIDTADALVQVIDGLQGVEDGTKRSEIALKFFGEEGTKQLAPLIFSTRNLKDTLEDIEFLYDPRSAQEYALAQQDLNLAFRALQQTIGQALVPALTDAARAGVDIINFLLEIPGPVYAAVAAAVALNVVLRNTLVQGAFAAVLSGGAQLVTGFAILRAQMGLTAAAATATSNAISAAFLTNPLGAVAVGLAAAISALAFAQQAFNADVEAGVARVQELEEAGATTEEAIRKTALELEATSSILARVYAQLSGGDGIASAFKELADSLTNPTKLFRNLVELFVPGGRDLEAFTQATEDAAQKLGEYEQNAQNAANAQKELGDYIAEGITSGPEFAEAVRQAGNAAETAARQEEIRSGIMETLAANTTEAVDATRDLIGLLDGQAEAQERVTEAIAAYNEEGGRTAENQRAIVEAAANAARANTEAWVAAEQSAGRYKTSVETAVYEIGQLELQVPKLPPGAAEDLKRQIAFMIAGAISENGGVVPLNIELTDVDAALATLQTYLQDPTLTPEAKIAVEAQIATLTQAKTDIEAGVSGATAEVSVNADTGPAKTQIEEALKGGTATITMDTQFSPGGYEAVKARKDFLTQQVNANIAIATEFGPGGYNAVKARKDFLTNAATGSIYIDVAFGPGGYNAVKSRVDFLTTPRRTTITQVVNQVTGTRVAGSTDNNTGRRAAANTLFSPVNMVRVSVDGRELRSVVRSEVRAAASRVPTGVA